MLYYALPYLTFTFQTKGGIFSIAWLALALLVFAGNLSAWLYAPKKIRSSINKGNQTKQRQRSY